MQPLTFHLLANAHLDPVWLWDWREGLNEGTTTVRTILDLMESDPDLTLIRGEASIYQHIESTDPETFERIGKMVKAGRWDVVGGTYVQPDTNLPATETLVRHFTTAQRYFKSTFGSAPRIAWLADSFGHSAGLPEILSKAGMTGFAFTRPEAPQMTLENPAFWWEGPAGSRVLAYRPLVGWYGANRDEMERRLDGTLEAAGKYPMRNVGLFYGLGNHGGGPSRRQLDEIRAWAQKHPGVKLVHSGLHRFFDALANEESQRKTPYPVKRGELNFCLRGCYASVAKFKYPYRRTEAQLVRAEKTASVIQAKLGGSNPDLDRAWKAVLFNSFHDILPGSSIERAYEDQTAWLGSAYHDAQRAEFEAVNQLANQIDTSVPKAEGDHPTRVPLLVWNPHPHEYSGPVELEAALDYRPLFRYQDRENDVPVEFFDHAGKAVPFQIIRNEHSAMTDVPWRKRVVFLAKLPPMGWSVYQLGLAKKMKASKPVSPVRAGKAGTIENGLYRIAARKGNSVLQIFHKGKPLFEGSGLSFINVEDSYGSWGGMTEEPSSIHLAKVRETWKITGIETLEHGPERAALWVRFAGARSRIDLTLFLSRKRPVVDVQARVFWNERCSRLKMVMPVGDQAEFDVPGAAVQRGIAGAVPGGRWVKVEGPLGSFGFASDSLYSFDCVKGKLRAAIVRASRYANSTVEKPEDNPWRPAVDAGELNFRFLLTREIRSLARLALELDQPLVTQTVPPHSGKLPARGSLVSLEPAHAQLIALKPAEDGRGWILRVQESHGKGGPLGVNWLGQKLDLGTLPAWSIQSRRLTRNGETWTASAVDLQENNI